MNKDREMYVSCKNIDTKILCRYVSFVNFEYFNFEKFKY